MWRCLWLYVNGGKWKRIIHRVEGVVQRCLVDVANTFCTCLRWFYFAICSGNEVCGFKVCGLLDKSTHTNSIMYPHYDSNRRFSQCVLNCCIWSLLNTKYRHYLAWPSYTKCRCSLPALVPGQPHRFSRENRDSLVGFMESFWRQWRYRPRKRQAWCSRK